MCIILNITTEENENEYNKPIVFKYEFKTTILENI